MAEVKAKVRIGRLTSVGMVGIEIGRLRVEVDLPAKAERVLVKWLLRNASSVRKLLSKGER
jgi:hypothetical protein